LDIQKLQPLNQQTDIFIRRFRFEDDEDLICYLDTWMEERKMPLFYSINDVPQVGFICFYKEQAVCAIFLRKCEGNVGMVDGLITNPHAGLKIRRKCIDAAVDEILEYARCFGGMKLISFSTNKRIIEIAKSKGFSVLNHQVFSIDFTNIKQ
jgi:hypothetical protein